MQWNLFLLSAPATARGVVDVEGVTAGEVRVHIAGLQLLLDVCRRLGIGLDERTGIVVVGHRHTVVGVGHAGGRDIGHAFAIAVAVASQRTGHAARQCVGLARDGIAKQQGAVGEQVPGEAGIVRTAVDGQRFVARVVEHAQIDAADSCARSK